MSKRISGSDLECTDSMLSDHFKHTIPKTNCTLHPFQLPWQLLYLLWVVWCPDKKIIRQKYKKIERQRPKKEFNIVVSGQYCTLTSIGSPWKDWICAPMPQEAIPGLCTNSVKGFRKSTAVLFATFFFRHGTEHPSDLNYECCICAANPFLSQWLENSDSVLFWTRRRLQCIQQTQKLLEKISSVSQGVTGSESPFIDVQMFSCLKVLSLGWSENKLDWSFGFELVS